MTLANFDQLLDKYANLLVHKGLAIVEGDHVQISTNIEVADFVRLVTKKAYEAGAASVIIDWIDDELTRLDYQYQSKEELAKFPQHAIDRAHHILGLKAKRLALRSSNPNALNGIDPDKISTAQKARATALHEVSTQIQANAISWLVAAAAGKEWAALVFPDLADSEAQVDALWDQIFKTTRVYADDPIAAWDEHVAILDEKAKFLNDAQFDALHYSAEGTDLTLGLPKNHIWESAGSLNQQGEIFIANMPTEEVFTAPDARRAEGHIRSSKPLSYGGTVIDGMTFHFKDGQITSVTAEKGQDTIQKLVEESEGARALGEVALVAHSTPISQSGITFFNTLFDENASNHLAIGAAYASSIQGGTKMTQEELKAAGLNRSITHVDFMVGTADMNIDGIRQDGSRVPIFRNGEWAI